MSKRKKTEPPPPTGSAGAVEPTPPPRSLLTRPLGLAGWDALEPVVLAALINEEPLLLVGPHGCAKSFLLERLAQALGSAYRFYNASLINYDDLVGIPVPDESRKRLEFITTDAAIWDAEIVFIDELNRTRPELQNKLFPIIHERRVQGLPLTKLRYRWAAINPPPAEDADLEDGGYLGVEPLDPALADRFNFIVDVPSWKALSHEEKHSILGDYYAGRHEFPVPVAELVRRGKEFYARLKHAPEPTLPDYLIVLESNTRTLSGGGWSARRVCKLLDSILAIQAARLALSTFEPAESRAEVLWEASAWLAIHHGQPAKTTPKGIDHHALLAAHREAWKVAGLEGSSPWLVLLQIPDRVDRVATAFRLGSMVNDDELGELVLDAHASLACTARRTAFALVTYLALQKRGGVRATVVESLAKDARRGLVPRQANLSLGPKHLPLARAVGSLKSGFAKNPPASERVRNSYLSNLLEGLLPDGYETTGPDDTAQFFLKVWDQFLGAASGEVA
jgi:hypothetical protein